MGKRKCVGCQHGESSTSMAYPYKTTWHCTLPSGNKVCKYNKEKVKNFFTPRRKQK